MAFRPPISDLRLPSSRLRSSFLPFAPSADGSPPRLFRSLIRQLTDALLPPVAERSRSPDLCPPTSDLRFPRFARCPFTPAPRFLHSFRNLNSFSHGSDISSCLTSPARSTSCRWQGCKKPEQAKPACIQYRVCYRIRRYRVRQHGMHIIQFQKRYVQFQVYRKRRGAHRTCHPAHVGQ